MAVNVKLGNNTINGVNVVKLQDAESPTTYHSFGLAPSGMYTLALNVDGSVVGYVYMDQGKSITANPYAPQKNNYRFIGWSTTQGGTTITYPYTPNANGTLYAVFEAGYRCTVSNLGVSSPSQVSFIKDANFTLQGLGIEEVTKGTDVFIKIPTMYRKVNTVSSNQITSFTIANAKIDNDYYPYPCFLTEDGQLLDYVLIGKYWNTSSSSCISTTAASATTVTVATGRTRAVARGLGYQLFDWMMQRLWQDLIICFKETVNTNSGSAWTYDELGIYWTTSYGWIDGMMGSTGTWKLCYKPSKYVSLDSTTGTIPADYVSAGYSQPTTTNEIQKLGYDSSNPFFNYPSAVVSNSSNNTYYCDQYYYSSGNRPVRSRVGDSNADSGAFYCLTSHDWSSPSGVRLCYRPLTA